MKVINLYGGPGTGKSTTAAELFAKMKRKTIKVELVNEYVKDHMYSGRKDALEQQEYIFAKQHHKQWTKQRTEKNKVDFIVTDSPLILSNIYAPKDDLYEHFEKYVLGIYNRFDNINIFLERNPNKLYQQYGREQTEAEAIIKDTEIKNYLSWNNIPYINVFADENAADEILTIVEECISRKQEK